MSPPDKVQVQTEIKLEDGVTIVPENVTDIQNYLDTFNKEIQGGEQVVQQVGVVAADEGGSEEGTYYVDQAGQYYYQSASCDGQQVMTVVSGLPGASGESGESFVALPASAASSQRDNVGGSAPLLIQAATGGGASASGGGTTVGGATVGGASAEGGGGATYQTVTIVPSETNPGELSYLLIVQQPGDEDEGEDGQKDKDEDDDHDLTVYDFDDAEDVGTVSGMESGDEDDKSKIVKFMPKKSQTVTQAHMCNYCNYTSPKRYLLSRHMKSHSEERPHKCSVCERGFKTLASLQNHVNTHTGTKPHRCKHCDSAFTTSGELVRHVRYKHTHEKPHKCTICDYASVELSKMRNHMRCHTGERPYQCPHCTYASPDTFKLKRHLRIHTGEKPYECDICHARFTQSNSLKAHKLIHSGQLHTSISPPSLLGVLTENSFNDFEDWNDFHFRVDNFSMSALQFAKFSVHSKSHEGEKCWRCELCPYASVSQRHLESHMLIHTDQKPYQCDQCDQSFRQKQLLRRHQNLYHNPNYVPPPPREKTHECPECQRAFRHKGNLIRHLSVHDPESLAQERQMLLKQGRQRKLQNINGQRVEVIPGDEDDEDEDDELNGQVMAVEGSDGQQYVVLEVIQLQDDNGQEQAVAVMAADGGLEQAVAALHGAGAEDDEEELDEEDEEEDDVHITPDMVEDHEMMSSLRHQTRQKTQHDMANCFGFDDDEEEEEEDDIGISLKQSNTKSIHLLRSGLQ
ncbi:transcriptional repressor CTCF [Nilaparvata lugens]|uniref:transcriptional repressor CTCF n=1 Tax=Nilaparvata lugens TaxID=108931 RepID=UPI00193DCF7C|nr:transcriptional repressor CTCF [Nilaparvata lugens]